MMLHAKRLADLNDMQSEREGHKSNKKNEKLLKSWFLNKGEGENVVTQTTQPSPP